MKPSLSGTSKHPPTTSRLFPVTSYNPRVSLFTVAASAIQIECFSSDDDDEDRPQPGVSALFFIHHASACLKKLLQTKHTRPSALELRQTSTGIPSNRPPIVGTPVSSGASTPSLCIDATPGPSAPRPSLLSLAKREAARRVLYSRFFRGPILGPDDIQNEMVKTEPTATPLIPSRPGDIDAHGEDAPRELANKEERKREKRLRKEAERAARKQKRDKEKHRAKNDDISGSEPSHERTSSPSHEQVSGLPISTTPDETPRVRREIKKKKRSRVAVVDDELDAQPTDERTRKGSSNFSRKRRRRGQSP